MTTIDGIILAILEDFGPDPLVNLSEFDYGTATSLSIAGMTIVGLGSTGRVYLRLFGSIPVPANPEWEAMPFIFTVSGEESDDTRIQTQGRECVIFLLFQSSNRSLVYAIHTEAEQLLIDHVQRFHTREDLSQDAITTILDQINQIGPPSAQELPLEAETSVLEGKAGLEFFTCSLDGELQPTTLSEGLKAPILVLVNHVNQTILRLTLSETVSERHAYLAGRAANQMNVERLRNAFRIRDVDDPIEIDMVLDKIRTGFDAGST